MKGKLRLLLVAVTLLLSPLGVTIPQLGQTSYSSPDPAPLLRTLYANGTSASVVTVQVWTLNPSSSLLKTFEANPSRPLLQDADFHTNDLEIGPVVGEHVTPQDAYTNATGFAALDFPEGTYLISVFKIYAGYYNLVDHLFPSWSITIKLKPELNPNPESIGPWEGPTTHYWPGMDFLSLTSLTAFSLVLVLALVLRVWRPKSSSEEEQKSPKVSDTPS